MLWTTLGVACVIYTTAELALAHAKRARSFRFGPVDVTAEAVELVVDRRVRNDATRMHVRRRSADR